MPVTVSALYRYPVKGCKAEPLDAAVVERRGLSGDRRWMLIDANGDFVSQRGEPRLTQFVAEPIQDGIRLQAPGVDLLHVDFPKADASVLTVDVWGTASSVRHADAADEWLLGWLGYPVRLVYQPDTARRSVKPARATTEEDRVSLADGYPLLLTNEASLAAVNTELGVPAEMLRFRPNVVVRGLNPFAELSLTRLTIGGVSFRAVKPCVRCNVVTLDPATGDRGKEPLRTMARLPQTRTDDGVVFGMNLVPDGEGTIRVGDRIEVA